MSHMSTKRVIYIYMDHEQHCQQLSCVLSNRAKHSINAQFRTEHLIKTVIYIECSVLSPVRMESLKPLLECNKGVVW